MTDDLRTCIAAVLFRLRGFQGWDDETEECREMWRRDADAVIRELGLREELKYPGRFSFMLPQRRRYVTEWTADE